MFKSKDRFAGPARDSALGIELDAAAAPSGEMAPPAAPMRWAAENPPFTDPGWVFEMELTGRRVLVVHGTEDRIAVPERAEAAARRLARTARVGFISVEGARHAMLRDGSRFERYAADFVTATLLDSRPSGPVADVLDGRDRVEV